MITQLESKFSDLENEKSRLLDLVKSISSEKLQVKENEHAWSIIQVFQHILYSESGTLGYVMKKSSGGWHTLEMEGELEKQNAHKLVTRLASNERYKAPDVLPDPPNDETIEQIQERWQVLRSKWRIFLDQVKEEDLNKLVFRQPAAGMITITATVDFLLNHLRHHEPQLERIMIALR